MSLRLRPLFSTLALLVLAIWVEPYLALPTSLLIASAILAMACGSLILRRATLPGIGLLALAVFLLGVLRAHEARAISQSDPIHYAGQRVTLSGQVEEPPEPGSRKSVHFILRTMTGRVWCRLNQGPAPRSGSTIEVRGDIEVPPPATNPGQFDWKAQLARQGVHALLVARSWKLVNSPQFLDTLLNTIRDSIQGASAHYLSSSDAALFDGLVLSVRANLPAELNDVFQRTGAVHVLSVSGLHLAALGLFLNLLLTRLLPIQHGLRVTMILIVVWLFALASGGSPAAIRSVVMLTVVLLAPLLRRDAEPLHSLAFAAVIVLLQNPLALFDPGTQLSFAASAGLLLWMPPLESLYFCWEPEMKRIPRLLRWAKLALSAGVVAQLATWPLVAWHFNLFSVIAPAANIPLVLLSEWLLLAGLVAVPLGCVPIIGPVWWFLLSLGLKLLRWLALQLGLPYWAAVSIVAPPLWCMMLYYALFWGAALYVRKIARRRLFAPATASLPFRLPSRSPLPTSDVP